MNRLGASIAGSNRVALITGGARGIGLAVARRLGERGQALCLLDRARSSLDEALDDLRGRGFTVDGVVGEVTVPGDVRQAFEKSAAIGSLTALVHCAGVSPTLATASEIFRVNFDGTRIVLDEAARALPSGAAIVVIASLAGHVARAAHRAAVGDPSDSGALERLESITEVPDVAYGVSKLALIELVNRRALEFGRRGIRVNTVSPNITNTPMGKSEIAGHEIILKMVAASPIPRVAEPEDIAAAIDFLLGPDASYITGTDLLIDGGGLTTFGRTPQA